MSDWDNLADGVVSTGFRPPNEITVLFDDRTLTFPMPPAATLTDLARRLAEENGPRGRMLSVTIKLGGESGVGHGLAASNAMTGHPVDVHPNNAPPQLTRLRSCVRRNG